MKKRIRNHQDMTLVESTHKLLLEALRHREQEIIQFLIILGPALGGFIWLLRNYGNGPGGKKIFVVGTVGVLSLLLLGAIYSLALGYNYRVIILQLAKLEYRFGLMDYILTGWPRTYDDFLKRCSKTLLGTEMPWCEPPEIIKVFWWAFLVGIAVITLTACCFRPEPWVVGILFMYGMTCFVAGGYRMPRYFGVKLREKCRPEDWASSK